MREGNHIHIFYASSVSEAHLNKAPDCLCALPSPQMYNDVLLCAYSGITHFYSVLKGGFHNEGYDELVPFGAVIKCCVAMVMMALISIVFLLIIKNTHSEMRTWRIENVLPHKIKKILFWHPNICFVLYLFAHYKKTSFCFHCY